MDDKNIDTTSPKFLTTFFIFGALIVAVAILGTKNVSKFS